ncbi:MAG TPA: Uma2 family endonuclease [Gemmataceae bacterium]|nr:Uma2 family endonuclease [Gemmataceae bacterium]
MVEIVLRHRTVDLPYTIRIYDVTEELFDELVDEDTKAELIDGVMIVHSPASPRHDDVTGFLRLLFRAYARGKGLGLVLGPDSLIHPAPGRRFAPDLFFFEQGRVPQPLPEEQFEGAPDLVLEVLSPSNRDDDLDVKRPAYREAGIPEIWLVDPDRQQVLVDRRRRKRYTTETVSEGRVTSTAVPGFWIEAAWLWQEPLPNELDCLHEIMDQPLRPKRKPR